MKKLLFFYGLECPHCKRMEKHVDKLIGEGFEFEKIEIWHNKENEEMMVKLDCEEEPCGGVPFFLNQNTSATVCGEVPLKDLRTWAEGK